MKVIVEGLAAEYRDEGQGPVILMLHGWKNDLHSFDSLMPLLSQRHRIVRLDLPGFGESDMPKEPWHLDDYVRFVKKFVEKLGLDLDVLIGHSLGGRITIKGVSSAVLKPRRIVLIASAGIARRKTFKNEVLRVAAKIGKFVTTIPPLSRWQQPLRYKLYQRIGSDYFAAGALKDTFLNIIAEDLSSAAPHISLPALIIWGRNDTTTPLSDGERLHALVKGSKLQVFDGGHFVHRERPKEVADEILRFV